MGAPIAQVIYVSCSPESFARDARVLVDGGLSLTAVTPDRSVSLRGGGRARRPLRPCAARRTALIDRFAAAMYPAPAAVPFV